MEVNVEGFDVERADMIELATRFFANILMTDRVLRNLVIDVERDETIDGMGECGEEDEGRNPRWFTILVRDAADDDDIIRTIAHEMVHVRQKALNQLDQSIRVTRRGFAIESTWMGKIWKPKKNEHAYFDAPWEIEAFGREVGLYQRWCEYIK